MLFQSTPVVLLYQTPSAIWILPEGRLRLAGKWLFPTLCGSAGAQLTVPTTVTAAKKMVGKCMVLMTVSKKVCNVWSVSHEKAGEMFRVSRKRIGELLYPSRRAFFGV